MKKETEKRLLESDKYANCQAKTAFVPPEVPISSKSLQKLPIASYTL